MRSWLLLCLSAMPLLGCSDSPSSDGSPPLVSEPSKDPDKPLPPAAPLPALLPADYGICWPVGYCWRNPLPQGSDLKDLVVLAPDNAWAGGELGLIMHWDGTTWAATQSNVTSDIVKLWASGPSDLWALTAAGEVLQGDGTKWKTRPTGGTAAAIAVWSTSATDAWVVDAQGSMRHFDGTAFTQLAQRSIILDPKATITGTSSSDVWIHIRRDPCNVWELFHWNGAAMEPAIRTVPGSCDLERPTSLHVAGVDDVWIVGGKNGDILHRKGGVLTSIPRGTDSYFGVWGSAPGDVFIASNSVSVLHWDGKSLTPLTSPQPLSGYVAGTGADNVFLSTQYRDGFVRWDGAALTSVKMYGDYKQFAGAAGSGRNDMWLYGRAGALRHWNGVRIDPIDNQLLTGSISLIGAANGGTPWAVGTDNNSNQQWLVPLSSDGVPTAPRQDLSHVVTAIHGSSPNDVWAVGSNGWMDGDARILHFDGTSWSPVKASGISLAAVYALSATDAWAAGYQTLLHWDGLSWKAVPGLPSLYFTGVWGAASNDVWFSTMSGMWHFDGSMVSSVASPLFGPGTPMRGTRASDIWMGDWISSLHFDGTSWTRFVNAPAGGNGTFLSLWGTSPIDTWAAGYSDAQVNGHTVRSYSLLKWSATDWQIKESPAVRNVWMFGDGKRLILYGNNGGYDYAPLRVRKL